MAASAQRPCVQQAVASITEIMYHDVVNPPAAARFYAYALLAGYETLSPKNSRLPAFPQRFKNFPPPLVDTFPAKRNDTLAVLYSILETAKNMIPSGYLLEAKEEELVKAFSYLSPGEIEASIGWSRSCARRIVQYSRTDGYFALSTLRRYQPINGIAYWQPTPPEYLPAVEPNWRTIRPFFLDSAGQCKPPPSTRFDTTKGSAFLALVKDVYTVSSNLTPEQKLAANFWDCNPFAVQYQGHMSVGLKKISPGGHWMGITGIACGNAHLDLPSTLLLHTVVALTLHDAFISCWEEKYRSNRIRPETAINRYLDEQWQPLLQTPPFPEYPSGHSVISMAAASVLTRFLGDHFAFTDTVETYIGLPPRQFASFTAAANEAKISRLYGGIHFRDAIENGAIEGADIGKLIISRSGAKPLRP
jgi:hypothetical protein